MMIESNTERGTLRLGSLVSSASGAAASQPVRPCTASTIASVNPERPKAVPTPILAGLNTDSEKPPGPGLAKPVTASASTITISAPPVTRSVRAESSMPRY